jgi:PBP1b-binding outer membrane lipoprotein LpoB
MIKYIAGLLLSMALLLVGCVKTDVDTPAASGEAMKVNVSLGLTGTSAYLSRAGEDPMN